VILNAPLPPKNLLRGFGEPNIGIKKIYVHIYTYISHGSTYERQKGLEKYKKGLKDTKRA